MAVILYDSFNRANNSTSLGVADTGQTWQKYGSHVWGIKDNTAYCFTPQWDWPNYIDIGKDDMVRITVKYASDANQQQVMWNIKDASNYHVIDGWEVLTNTNGNWWSRGAIPTDKLKQGSILVVEIEGAWFRVFVDGVKYAEVEDVSMKGGTKYGFSGNNTGGAFDDFKVETLGADPVPTKTKIGEHRISGAILPIYSLDSIPLGNQLRTYHPTKGIGCFELVPTTDANASKVRLFAKGIIQSIKKELSTNVNISSLSVVTHQDDDLGGLNPDVYNDIQSAGTTGTVIVCYLTAGDAGQGWGTYAQNREKGVQASYAYMAGKTNTWTTGTMTIAGKTIAYARLTGTNIYHFYFRLPDASDSFGGGATISLYKLWTGSITSIKAVDSALTYTKAELITTIASFIDTYSANTYRHLYHLGTLGDGEHYEHHAGGYFGNAGLLASTTIPSTIVAYRTDTLSETAGWTQISASEETAKRGALDAYVPFDPGLANWRNDPEIVSDMSKVWRYSYTKSAVTPPATTIVTAGLIGYWNAKQGLSGTAWNNIAPVTTGKYNGTITGATITANQFLSFDGVGDSLTIGAIQAGDKLTSYEVEIYMESPFDGTLGTGIGSTGELAYMPFATANAGMSNVSVLAVKTDGTKVFLSDESGTAKVLPKNTLFKLNFSVNVSTRQETVYVDNTQVVQSIMSGASSNLDNVRFGGASWDASYALKGKIYSAKIYNRILTPSERTQNSANGKEIGL